MKGVGKGNNPKKSDAFKEKIFKKGVSGNPKGRPIGSLSLRDRMKKFLELDVQVAMPDGTITSQTVLDSVILSLLAQALKGNTIAIKEVLDRNFGKEPEKLEIEDNELRNSVEEIKESMELLKQNEQPY
jgi:hypothetical protein